MLLLRWEATAIPGSHHNCFFYYRGPSSKSPDVELQRYHQQVEDNTTKALVNTLEHSGAEVTRSFLREFSPPNVELAAADEEAEFYLQRGPSTQGAEMGVLLGLSLLGEIEPRSFDAAPEQGGSRIDASIRVPGSISLYIETKTVERLDGAQLNRHARRWELPEAERIGGSWQAPSAWVLATWADAWRWARRERDRTSDLTASFLLSQFGEYLEILGFAPWAGFGVSDFEIFAVPTPERQLALQSKMAGLWERVLEELSREERKRLGTVHAGRVGRTRDPAWAQTNRGERGANLTVELSERELQLNLVGWDARQSAVVLEWLDKAGAARLPPSTELVVWERKAKRDKNGNPFWMGAPGVELHKFSTSEISSGAFKSWRRNWEASGRTEFTRLAYHLRKTWSRGEVLDLAERLPAELQSHVREFLPVLAAINRR